MKNSKMPAAAAMAANTGNAAGEHVPWEAECQVMVRTKEGNALNGVVAYGDGVSFRADRPIPGGKMVELVVCETFLFEAEVVGCAPLPASVGGYLVRARFHNVSEALADVVRDEINRLVESGT